MNTINDMYGINCTDTTKSNTVVKLRILYLTMNRPALISKVFSVKIQISVVKWDSLKIVVQPMSMVPEDIHKNLRITYNILYVCMA